MVPVPEDNTLEVDTQMSLRHTFLQHHIVRHLSAKSALKSPPKATVSEAPIG